MTLRLRRDAIAAAYDYLRLSDPFRAWHLPPSSEVRFRIVRDSKMFAEFTVANGVYTIRISAAKNGHSDTLLGTLAHEMIHLRQELTGDREVHGARFKRMAARVCAAHGFDPLAF
jgi:hypothetical protein